MAKGPRKKSHLGQPEERPQGILDTVFRGLLVPLALEALLIPFRPVLWLLGVVSQPFVWLLTWKQRRHAEALLARKRYLEGAEFTELLDSADDAIGRLLSLRGELQRRDAEF